MAEDVRRGTGGWDGQKKIGARQGVAWDPLGQLFRVISGGFNRRFVPGDGRILGS